MNNSTVQHEASRSGVPLKDAVIFITGSSRGIGAKTAEILAQRGAHPIINYREKAKRAQKLVDEIHANGHQASLIGGDITDPAAVEKIVQEIKDQCGKLDVLILNASGGLEMGKDEDYPMKVNRDAQVNLINALLPVIKDQGKIVFVTSHQAHFLGKKPVPHEYEPIAQSKRAGEDAIRELLGNNAQVSLTVVSGDMIDGTIIVTLLERRNPQAVQDRREKGGKLPTVEEFATAIADTIAESTPQGHTVYIGGEDYLTT